MACIGTQKPRANDDPYGVGVGEQSGKRVKSLRALERALLPEPFRYCSTPGPRWAHCQFCPLAPTLLPSPHVSQARCGPRMHINVSTDSAPAPDIVSAPGITHPLGRRGAAMRRGADADRGTGAPYVIYTVLFGLVRKSFHCLHPCGSRPTYGVHLIYHLHAKHWNGHNPSIQLWERGLGCDTSELSDACGPPW
jgi:hypothetical protein